MEAYLKIRHKLNLAQQDLEQALKLHFASCIAILVANFAQSPIHARFFSNPEHPIMMWQDRCFTCRRSLNPNEIYAAVTLASSPTVTYCDHGHLEFEVDNRSCFDYDSLSTRFRVNWSSIYDENDQILEVVPMMAYWVDEPNSSMKTIKFLALIQTFLPNFASFPELFRSCMSFSYS
jgi:hypothetical protein